MYNITGKGLVTLVSHSVTVRLDDDSFFKALPRLPQMFGIMGKALVTFMGQSATVRLVTTVLHGASTAATRARRHGQGPCHVHASVRDGPTGYDSFLKALPGLQQMFDITDSNLVAFISVSVAVRRAEDSF